jgi:hypothetical protein
VLRRKRHDEDEPPYDETAPGTSEYPVEMARDRYGGFTFAAAFFGWLVAVALTVLLAGVVGAVATAAGASLSITQSQAEREAGTIGLATAVALLLILLVAYFSGGYVAGRMSRFDGGRQGVGVWLLGLLVSILVAVLGAVFGTQYDVFDRVDLPSLPVPTSTLTIGGAVTVVAIVVGTLVAAMLGGKAGQRFHTKIDRAVG